ncbi:DUF2993 domain-containing protein [Staphylococcus chromogenes]|nr:DUF2993 domain-containing protein [Staphylococcus chromogenes]
MSTSSKGSLVWKILISLALIVVIGLIVVEFGLRWYISDSMKKQLAADAGSSQVNVDDASIKFGPTPLLLSAATRNVPSVDIETPSTLNITQGAVPKVSGSPAAKLHISDMDIHNPNDPVAGHLVVNTQVPEEFLLAQIQSAMAEQQQHQTTKNDLASQLMSNLVKVTDVQANGEKGAIEVTLTDGAATLDLKPTAKDGQVKFEAANAQLLGISMPKQVTDAISKGLEQQATDVGNELKIEKMDVINDALDITFSGDNVPLSQAQQQR